MRLAGKKVIVTGANRSIGKAIALLFAKEGAELVISYRFDRLATILIHSNQNAYENYQL